MSLNVDLNDVVHKLMASNRQKMLTERRYFYPLAEPTYGPEEILEAVDSMVSYKTTMWEKVALFEKRFGEKYGGEAIMVNSGSSADLLIAFSLLEKTGGDLKPGDEVLVPAVTWPTHVWSLIMAGFQVRLVDVSSDTCNFDFNKLVDSVSPKTKAIFVVHLLGNMGEMEQLEAFCSANQLVLLEDCCEALGSSFNTRLAGTFGLASSFSFFFSHHLVTMEGGMILTQNKEFAARCRLLRSHGWSRNQVPIGEVNEFQDRYRFVTWGFNVRPTELQAGFGLVQLNKVDELNNHRNRNAEILSSSIREFSTVINTMRITPGVSCNWFAFPLLISSQANFTREDLIKFLEMNGIETRPIVTGNLARQDASQSFPEISFGELAGANKIHDKGIYIGVHADESIDRVSKVAKVLESFLICRSA